MIRVVSFNFQGTVYPVFIDDTVTGYNGKDVLSRPGVYEEVANEKLSLPLVSMQGSIDGYSTKCMALLVAIAEGGESEYQMQDCTNQVKSLIAVPETAAKMMLSREDQETREFLETALEVIRYYEQVTPETKVFLPEEAFRFVDPEIAKKMKSNRHMYVLKNSENQEILQKTPTSTFGVVLPSVEDLHSDIDVAPSAMDVLRVIAPCRREVSSGVYQYNSIYHTPYYKVDPKIRGNVPSYLNYLNGFPKNDMLGIQSYERHMYDNLYKFVCADIAHFVGEIVTGLFFTTHLGQNIKRMLTCRSEELLSKQATEVNSLSGDGVQCNITYSALQELFTDGIDTAKLARFVKESLTFDAGVLEKMVDEKSASVHVVDIENLPFVLDLSDEEKDRIAVKLMDKSVLTRAMLEYLLSLCLKAYEVNWGHSGATRAIPMLVFSPGIQMMNEVMADYLNQMISGRPAPDSTDFSVLYEVQTKSDDDEDSDDEIFTKFDYYITDDTAMKIRSGVLSSDFFTSKVTGAETSEAAIVQYWRKVNGENGLNYFISSAFTMTGNMNVLIECFIKLMRWGEMKPSLLILQDNPEIRTVFDLNTGKEIPNTAIVDESQLVLSNGCKYSLEGVLTAQDIVGAESAIVGFLLSKNYGIKKYFLASWVDVGEMVSLNEVDIDALKTVTDVPLTGESVHDISQFENSGFQFYSSTHNIEQGLQYNAQPAALSELALLITPGILRSAEYLRSKQNKVIVTTKDRQYAILSNYGNVVRSLYASDGERLRGDSVSTADISAISLKAYNMFVAGEKDQAKDVNQVRANKAVLTMNLEEDSCKFSDADLIGKFTIISDVDMQSDLPAIEFTDLQMRQVSKKVRDRIVLLLLETQDAFLLCRKDIKPSELLVNDHKIEHRKYSMFASVIKALKAGQTVNISNSKTGVKKPAQLHRSLSEFI